jgi:hypothetical protein
LGCLLQAEPDESCRPFARKVLESPYDSKTLQIYTHIYPLWDIACARVFDYSCSQEDSPVGVIGW